MKTKILIGYSTNKDLKFQKYFEKTLKKSVGCECEFQAIYNTGSMSLTQVYNKIWQSYPFDESYVFVFIHHDIHFKSNGWGKTILNLFNSDSKPDIVGVAGTDTLFAHGAWWLNLEGKMTGANLYGKVWHINKKKTWRSDFTNDKKCDKLQPVVTVDGLFIAFDPDSCEEFDDETFQGFHFYDTSFCIRNVLAGKKVFVTETIPICHESVGQLSVQWEENRIKFTEKYPGVHYINKDKL